MSDPDKAPLETDVLEIVRAERAIPEPAADVKARMFAAVAARVGPPGGGGGGGPTGHAPRAALAGWRGAVAVAVSFGLGFAVRSAFPPEPRVVIAERVPLSAAPPVPQDEPAPPPSAPAAPVPTQAPRASASAEPDNRSLAGERALLDVARTALANGDPARALQAVARHEKTYPNGLLVEEREALAVKALAAAGRNDEARARGGRFVKRFPNGLMRPAVEGVLQSIGGAP
jgi:hypothetical protein